MTSHLILGGSGFIGRHVARTLSQTGQIVTVVDLRPLSVPIDPIKFVALDLARLSDSDFDHLIASIDVIHHYAWNTIPASANLDPLSDLTINARVTLQILEAIKRRGGGRIIFASSGGTVYGVLKDVPALETHPLNPITAYGVSKLACEKYIQLYRYLHGIDGRIIRIANPYGSGQNPNLGQGVISTYINRAIRREPILIWGDGTNIRDFIHINDLVAAIISLTNYELNEPEGTPVFNVGGSQGHSINDVISIIQEALPYSLEIHKQSSRHFDIPISLLSIERARQMLNWHPLINTASGIQSTMAEIAADPNRLFAHIN